MFEHKGVDVRVERVSKQYKMAAEEVHALRESTWEVKKGEAVAILGPSGCGKTTLLNLLGGVDRPTTGKILIITAIENLELPMVMAGVPESACQARAKALLGLVGLESKGQKLPEELSG